MFGHGVQYKVAIVLIYNTTRRSNICPFFDYISLLKQDVYKLNIIQEIKLTYNQPKNT